MRAFKYIRVSDEEAARDGYSMIAQDTLLDRKLAEWGFDCVGSYSDDGYSAKNTKRPDFQRMMKDVDTKKPDVIVFWRLDRFTRNSRDFQKVMEGLDKKSCGIKSATESIDTTTAIGRFQLELTISLGQLERETTAERVHFVMEERHRKGFRNGAIAPYGYRLEGGKLFIVPEESEIIKEIYTIYQQPLSTRAIAKLFNQDIVKYPSGRGGNWTDHSIGYIITNPVYCGKLRWDGIISQGNHDPIITEDEYDEVQHMRTKRYVNHEKVCSDFYFTSVLKCGRCGYGMTGFTQHNNGKSVRAYRCIGRANYGVCNMPNLREQTIAEAFLASLDGDRAKKHLIVRDVIPQDNEHEQDSLKRQLEDVKRRRKKWQEAFAGEAISLDELRAHMDEEKAKEELIRSKLEAAPDISIRPRDEMLKLIESFRNLWYEIDDNMAKKKFIQFMFKDIIANSPVEKGISRRGKVIPVDIISWLIH